MTFKAWNNTLIEKTHLKFCKRYLEISNTSNVASRSEIGRFPLIIAFKVREGNPLFLLGVLCIIDCPVQLIREVFWDCVCVDTHLPRFEVLAYVLPPFDANSRGDSCVLGVHLWNVYLGLLFCLRKAYIFQAFAEGLLSLCVCWISKVLIFLKCAESS